MRVVPVRFTDDVAGMQKFLEALGLHPTLTSDSPGWVSLSAAGGGMGLHSTATAATPQTSGSTDLSFEADEPLEDLAERLTAAGFEPVILDEAFGRVLQVRDPDGVLVQVNGAMTDLYGYSPA